MSEDRPNYGKRNTDTDETKIALMANDIGYIKASIESINSKMEEFTKRFVSQDEFRPVRNVVYGMVAVILLTVAGAILLLVVK